MRQQILSYFKGKVREVLNFFLPIEQGFADYSLWTKSSLPPLFVNKVLSEHGHTQCVCVYTVYSYFQSTVVELSSDRDHVTCRA